MSDLIDRQAAVDAVKYGALSAAMVYGRTDAGRTALVETVKAIKAIPSAQTEQSDTSEFWRKRADFYSDMYMDLIGEMGKGVKVESVQISENGIAFIKEQPPAQSEETCDTCKHGYFGGRQCDNCRVGYPSHYERRTDEAD